MPLSKADFLDFPTPVIGLYETAADAHADMMKAVGEAMREAKEGEYFPSEALFLESLNALWTRLYRVSAKST